MKFQLTNTSQPDPIEIDYLSNMATSGKNQETDELVVTGPGAENTTHGPYQRYLTSLLGTHPHLQVLEQFIDEKDWDRWRRAGHPKDCGLTKFNVVVADIEHFAGHVPTGIQPSGLQTSQHDLEEYLAHHPVNGADSLRMYLIEDLSRDVIEYFGSRFNLDPNFFESHLRDHERLLSGRSLLQYLFAVHPTAPTISETCTANFFTASFFRPYKFALGGETAWKDVQRIRWQTANVMRHGIAYRELKTTDTFFLTERFTVMLLLREKEEGPATGWYNALGAPWNSPTCANMCSNHNI